MGRGQRTLFWLAALAVIGGIWLRFVDLGFPEHLTWDEHHFVKNARNYLAGRPDWNDHPPLGKLLMAWSLSLLGDNSFAFRLPSALMGVGGIVAAGCLSRRLHGSNWAAVLAAVFIAGDGFHIAYSRTALLDGMLTTVSLTTLLCMTWSAPMTRLLLGLLIGSAMSVKMSALVLFGPLTLLALLRIGTAHQWFGLGESAPAWARDRFKHWSLELLSVGLVATVAGAVYLGWWMFGLELTGKAHSLADAWEASQAMMAHHAKLTDWEHPLLSRWWTWGLPKRPILLRHDQVGDGLVRVMTSMGNPLLWWSVVLALFLSLEGLVKGAVRRGFPGMHSRLFLLCAFVAYISPWIVTNRDTYIYHYLPAYSVGIVMLSGLFAEWSEEEGNRRWAILALGAFTLVSVFYAPVWSQLPMTEDALKLRPLIR